MYTWTQNETITAAKLNAMQNRPNMEVVGKSGIGNSGVTASALSAEMICNPPTFIFNGPVSLDITEHEVGNLKFEYDKGSEEWKIRTGTNGITGKGNYAPQNLRWLCKSQLPNDGKSYVWQKISVDPYGTPTGVQTCVKSNATMNTCLWQPVSGKSGVIWRRMASI